MKWNHQRGDRAAKKQAQASTRTALCRSMAKLGHRHRSLGGKTEQEAVPHKRVKHVGVRQ